MNLHGDGSWRFLAFKGCLAIWTDTPPCRFHRWTQRIVFGFRWDKPK